MKISASGGVINYSEIKTVIFSDKLMVSVFRMPVNDVINVSFSKKGNENVWAKRINSNGAVVRKLI